MPIVTLVGGPCDGDHVSVDDGQRDINCFPQRRTPTSHEIRRAAEGQTAETYKVVRYTRRTIGCNTNNIHPYPIFHDYFAPADMADVEAIRILITNYKGPR